MNWSRQSAAGRLLAASAWTAAGVSLWGAPAQAGIFDLFGTRSAPQQAQPAPARAKADKAAMARADAKWKDTRPLAQGLLPASAAGPITIVVSTNRQHLTVYDGDKPVARTVVSTGVEGHSTPHGVFSVLEKQVFHRSTIYSGAPMPYMQRLTWSGVAMHEGHVTGRPASHGCIRLPAAFAKDLFRYTRRGARVIIAREEATPTPIASVAPFTNAAPRRYVMGEAADAGRMPGEIGMPDHTIGSAQFRTKIDMVGAAPATALISRRTGMLYVRRAFAPIFEAPVSIDEPNRPIGAHYYVARKMGADEVVWSTVTITGPVREALATNAPAGATRSDERAGVAMPSSADEALKRVHLAPGVQQRLNMLLSQGATLIISDDDARLRESQAGSNFVAVVN